MNREMRRQERSNQQKKNGANRKLPKTESSKPLVLRIVTIVILVIMVLGFFILPLLL